MPSTVARILKVNHGGERGASTHDWDIRSTLLVADHEAA